MVCDSVEPFSSCNMTLLSSRLLYSLLVFIFILFLVNMFSDEFAGLIFFYLGMEYFLCNYNALLCWQKIVVPSDTRKKNLANCAIALQYLRQAGVSLCDEDGMIIVGDDVANGDRELTLSLLWNIFVHLQVCRSLSSPNFSQKLYCRSLWHLIFFYELLNCNSYFVMKPAATSSGQQNNFT